VGACLRQRPAQEVKNRLPIAVTLRALAVTPRALAVTPRALAVTLRALAVTLRALSLQQSCPPESSHGIFCECCATRAAISVDPFPDVAIFLDFGGRTPIAWSSKLTQATTGRPGCASIVREYLSGGPHATRAAFTDFWRTELISLLRNFAACTMAACTMKVCASKP